MQKKILARVRRPDQNLLFLYEQINRLFFQELQDILCIFPHAPDIFRCLRAVFQDKISLRRESFTSLKKLWKVQRAVENPLVQIPDAIIIVQVIRDNPAAERFHDMRKVPSVCMGMANIDQDTGIKTAALFDELPFVEKHVFV